MFKFLRRKLTDCSELPEPQPLSARDKALAENDRACLAAGKAEERWLDARIMADEAEDAGEPESRVRALRSIADEREAQYEKARAEEDRALDAAFPYM